MAPIRVVVADAQASARKRICRLLARYARIESVGEAGDADQVKAAVAKLKPNMLLLDASLFEELEPLETLLGKSPHTRILLLTEGSPGDEFARHIRAGAWGSLPKGEAKGVLAKAIKAVAAGEIWGKRTDISRAIEELAAVVPPVGRRASSLPSRLTPREVKIAELVARGCRNREIAERLRVSEKTVKNRLTLIFRKLACRNRAQLAALLMRSLWARPAGTSGPGTSGRPSPTSR